MTWYWCDTDSRAWCRCQLRRAVSGARTGSYFLEQSHHRALRRSLHAARPCHDPTLHGRHPHSNSDTNTPTSFDVVVTTTLARPSSGVDTHRPKHAQAPAVEIPSTVVLSAQVKIPVTLGRGAHPFRSRSVFTGWLDAGATARLGGHASKFQRRSNPQLGGSRRGWGGGSEREEGGAEPSTPADHPPRCRDNGHEPAREWRQR
ncbi:hypothetical protein KM043_013137 [Ampulex compressa]|nr:hypothetical protein KM043_013137 [Ampulex compressa]